MLIFTSLLLASGGWNCQISGAEEEVLVFVLITNVSLWRRYNSHFQIRKLMFSNSDGLQGLMMYHCTNQRCSKSITFRYKGDSADECEDD